MSKLTSLLVSLRAGAPLATRELPASAVEHPAAAALH